MSNTTLGYIENVLKNYNFVTPLNARGETLPIMYSPKTGREQHYWHEGGKFVIQNHIRRVIDKSVYNGKINEVIHAITQVKGVKLDEMNHPKHNIVLVKNGWINLETFEFMSYAETNQKEIDLLNKYNRTWQLPVNYELETHNNSYVHFLREIMGVSLEQDWHEVVGFTLTSGYKYKKLFCLYGEGDTGKSTLLGVIRSFIGPNNIVSVGPQKLSENRFASSTLYGKVANLGGDIAGTEITDTSTLKQLCGEDTVNAEYKRESAFEFINSAKMYFAMNEVPRSRDETMAWYNRIKFFLFKKSESAWISQNTREKLINEMTTEEGLSAILNKALEGLKRLKKRGHFLNTYQPKLTYIKLSEPVRYFVDNDCIDDGWTHKLELYEQFREMPYAPDISVTSFYRDMKPLGFDHRVRVDEDYKYVYRLTMKPFRDKKIISEEFN